MKTLSSDLLERLQSDALTLCLCWSLVRRDGFELRVTDHDRPLSIDGFEFEPGVSMEGGRFTQSLDLRPGQAAAGGALSSDAIDISDLKSGLWDGCQVQVARADWQRPDLGMIHIWSGYFSEIQYTPGGRFEAELVSLKADLERPIGRVLQRQCDAQLGDERCQVDPAGRSCDQSFQTCRDVFANTDNFRGFPDMPGNDFVLAGPAASGNDGSKR
ncbi:MAG: DUF2163 domain-containing protein [Henriciella sp.]